MPNRPEPTLPEPTSPGPTSPGPTSPGPAIRQLSSRIAYENPWMTVSEDDIELLDGSRSIYGVVHKPNFAIVIAVDGDRIHLVEQFRYTIGQRRWELPQGVVAGSTSPEQMAATELAEETGLRAGSFTVLGFLHLAYGCMTAGFHVVLATDLVEGEPHREVSEQDMRSAWFTIDEMWRMIDDGEFTDAPSLAALALFARSGYAETSSTIRPKGPAS